MNQFLINLAGWIPAVVLPVASLVQLIKIIKVKEVKGVSLFTWLMFGLANTGLYFFTEKYFALQSLLGLLLTAILDFTVVGLIIHYKKRVKITE
jgi:uncharacterized protein with PQ loop repeat